MKEFTILIKPLTPIWTGDADRKNTSLRETGVIGSLRWWYGVLIRGLGRTACDPTNEDSRCKLDQNKFNTAIKSGKTAQQSLDDQKICSVCQLFGCTGWARKFRLEVDFNTIIPHVWIGTREKYHKRNVAGFMTDGSIALTFIPLREINKSEWILLNAIIKIIGDYGAIGSRISQGNGVIEIIKNNLPENETKVNVSELKNRGEIADSGLKDFVFYKFHLRFKDDISKVIEKKAFWTHNPDHKGFYDNWDGWKTLWANYHFLPIAFHIRDAARHFEENSNKRHSIFGKLGQGSKVFVSHGYKIDEKTVEFRVWGYNADEALKNIIKKDLEGALKQKLFSDGKDALKTCELNEEKSGEKLLEGLK